MTSLLPAKPRSSAWLMSGAFTAICEKLRKVCRQTTICQTSKRIAGSETPVVGSAHIGRVYLAAPASD